MLEINKDWGYLIKAKGCVTKLVDPPELEPLKFLTLLRFAVMMSMKALNEFFRSLDWFAVEHGMSLMPTLLNASLLNAPRVSKAPSRKPFVLESSHPYEHNLDVYFPVKVPGARKLSIAFDPQTATEKDCDYVRFYA